MLGRSFFHLYHFPWLEKFATACKAIELDPNYQPLLTDDEICKFSNSLVIQKDNAIKLDEKYGAVYQIKKIKYEYDDFPYGNNVFKTIDNSLIIFVNMKGEYSIHFNKNAEIGNYRNPILELNIHSFLNREPLTIPNTEHLVETCAEINRLSF